MTYKNGDPFDFIFADWLLMYFNDRYLKSFFENLKHLAHKTTLIYIRCSCNSAINGSTVGQKAI